MSEHILVCVAWPYAKSSTHVGQIVGAYLPADTFARYHRLKGNHVLMVSGSDEHGTPILVDSYELTIFPDARAIIKGTDDEQVARSVYARYVGM